jgi:hypothetical protein
LINNRGRRDYMPITIKKGDQSIKHGNAIISKDVKGYEDDQYFVKKTEKALEILKEFGLPDLKKK